MRLKCCHVTRIITLQQHFTAALVTRSQTPGGLCEMQLPVTQRARVCVRVGPSGAAGGQSAEQLQEQRH